MTGTVIDFPATGLLYKGGFGDGDLPDVVLNDLWETHGPDAVKAVTRGEARGENWHHRVLIPVVRDVLIPGLPVPVDYYTIESTLHNPIRATMVNGRTPTRRYPVLHDAPLLAGYKVTLPVRFLADLALGHESLDGLANIPLSNLNRAVAAGLSIAEIRSLHAAGDLHQDSVTVLAALRQVDHA